MSPGVWVYGGLDETWKRNAAVTTEIEGLSPAVTFDAITVATGLDHVTVKSLDAAAFGASSFAIAVTGSQMIELRDKPAEGKPRPTLAMLAAAVQKAPANASKPPPLPPFALSPGAPGPAGVPTSPALPGAPPLLS